MKYLFIVQGEGRGHMTQAISLSAILARHRHTVEKVYLGRSPQREVPEFFIDTFRGKLDYFRSPNFSPDRERKGINMPRTLLVNLFLIPVFVAEIFRMAWRIRKSDADVVIGFYDIIGGLGMWLSFSRKKYFVISHHFYFSLGFSYPKGYKFQKYLLKFHSFLCSRRANSKLALSFTENVPGKRGYDVVPPLLRPEVFNMRPKEEGYILAYLLNPGFLKDMIGWCMHNPGFHVVVFTDSIPPGPTPPANLKIHKLGSLDFLESMAKCQLVVSTAGFESVCEAAYLGKRILLIPSKNHFEQECNALDAARAGLAQYSSSFNPDLILEPAGRAKAGETTSKIISENPAYDLKMTGINEDFRQWCQKSEGRFINLICDQK